MKTEVKIAEFKSRLSAYLRSVRQGQEIVIKDRETPIARLTPYQAAGNRLGSKPATGSLQELDALFEQATRPKTLKPGDLEEASRETKKEYLDKWPL